MLGAMNHFISKIVLVGAGAGLLGLASLGAATTALAAAPAASVQQGQQVQKPDRKVIHRAVFEAEAGAVGLTPAELRKALRDGKTVQQIAAAKDLTKEQVAGRMVVTLRPVFDGLVARHEITRKQADRVLDRVGKGAIPYWDGLHRKK
jgi:hypothetical protein